MAKRVIVILRRFDMPNWFEQLSEPVQDLVRAAREIVSDFDRYGEVLQHGDNGEYGEESSIIQLKLALEKLGG